ncbi:hypothetical protein HYQ46_004452 [Verticillium longisporum]|nr:hypothetical protein HYQ46_004452 [Verticillium longisporum]
MPLPARTSRFPSSGRAYPCLPLCWLGPLQRGRLTFNSHYFWEGSNVILRTSAIAAVLELNKAVKFTFEFYPRVAGNSVTYTLDPTDEC